MRCAITVVAAAGSSDIRRAATAEVPMANEIGMPANRRTAKTSPRISASFMSVQPGGLPRRFRLSPDRLEEEEEGIYQILQQRKRAKISVWSRMNLQDVKRSIACHPDILHIGAPVSYVQIYNKLKKNKGWVIKNVLECVEAAKSQKVEVTVGLEDASRSDRGFLLSMIK